MAKKSKTSGKILKPPKAKGPTPIDVKKILLKGLKGETDEQRLVTEEEIKPEFQEPRSLFFKQEFAQERQGINKWLS